MFTSYACRVSDETGLGGYSGCGTEKQTAINQATKHCKKPQSIEVWKLKSELPFMEIDSCEDADKSHCDYWFDTYGTLCSIRCEVTKLD